MTQVSATLTIRTNKSLIPNKQTLKALENSRNRKNLTTYKNSDDLFEDLGI